jgi:COMPASS component SWD1
VATSGSIHLWTRTYPDNWAAFAPGFEELEENVEYDEREDEFDIVSHPILDKANRIGR